MWLFATLTHPSDWVATLIVNPPTSIESIDFIKEASLTVRANSGVAFACYLYYLSMHIQEIASIDIDSDHLCSTDTDT